MKKISIINGPNLNLLGKREPELYGTENFVDYLNKLKKKKIFSEMDITYYQSNHEGKIIDILHAIGFQSDGIVLNAGAYTHTSLGIADAVKSIPSPVIEIHISNIHSRESFRKKSFLSSVCQGTIFGFGLKSYELGIFSFFRKIFLKNFINILNILDNFLSSTSIFYGYFKVFRH